jgi:hypothetical protein
MGCGSSLVLLVGRRSHSWRKPLPLPLLVLGLALFTDLILSKGCPISAFIQRNSSLAEHKEDWHQLACYEFFDCHLPTFLLIPTS